MHKELAVCLIIVSVPHRSAMITIVIVIMPLQV